MKPNGASNAGRTESVDHGAHDDPISKDGHTGHSRESTRAANGEDVRRCRFAGIIGLLRRRMIPYASDINGYNNRYH
jgi:hypothetical protein